MSQGFDYLWESGPQMRQCSHFKLGTDSVLLGNFADAGGAKKGIDLGCCTGVLSLLLLSRSDKLHMTGIEIDPEAAEVAKQNMAVNGLTDRSEIICGNILDYKQFPPGGFDLVISNPPYFSVDSGSVSPNSRKAAARGEVSCTFSDIAAAARYLCRWDGKVFFVHKPERLVEIFRLMSESGIEPKRLRMVAHSVAAEPSLVLIEGRRGGNPGLKIEPPLLIKNSDGTDTDEIQKIYHRNP